MVQYNIVLVKSDFPSTYFASKKEITLYNH